ncbi:MAG TPA: orotate phosphoribosyltransferase, partial [Candidatus Paceibacterota bacterium]|nr:orotate phosphoribosyltransferase [Candidatus Paceibacterota bacterium]
MDASSFIAYALSQTAIEFPRGGRRLRSGRVSPYFFNVGRFDTAYALGKLAEAYASAILTAVTVETSTHPEVIFGPAYKGIVLAAQTAIQLARIYYPFRERLGYAYNRKERKNHGEGGVMVGMSLRGKRVVIVDDVISSGGSGDEAVALVRREGGVPIGYVIGLDRLESDPESGTSVSETFTARHGIPVRAVSTVRDLTSFLERNPEYPNAADVRRRIEEYLGL